MTHNSTQEQNMKADLGKTSGTSPPPLVNDPDAMMAAQIDAELVARLKTAFKELDDAECASARAEGAWIGTKELLEKRRVEWEALEKPREEKVKATGTILVEARERHPTREAFGKILEAVGIEERQARTYISFALGKTDYKEHCAQNAAAVKKSREKNRDKVLAERAEKKAAKKLANAPPKSTSKAKQRAMASGHGLSSVKDLLRQLSMLGKKRPGKDKIGAIAVQNILDEYGDGKVTNLKTADYEAIRERCRQEIGIMGYVPNEPGADKPVEHDPVWAEQPVEPPTDFVLTKPVIFGPDGKQADPAASEVVLNALCGMADDPEACKAFVTAHVAEQPEWEPDPDAVAIGKLVAKAKAGFDRADSFGRDGADRNARALAGFMDECRASPFLPRLNDDGLVKAAEFIMSRGFVEPTGEWKGE
jgi:hypothetical protein